MTYTESDQWSLRKVISWLKARLTFSKIAIDFHFNSHIAQKATGVEVIIPKHYNSKELKLAKELAEIISDTLGIKKRRGRLYYHNNIPGVKTENESQYKRIGILSKVQGINILIETCFISNPYDMIKYRDYYDELVNNIATIIAKNY